jgi:hypothetical protein
MPWLSFRGQALLPLDGYDNMVAEIMMFTGNATLEKTVELQFPRQFQVSTGSA